MFSRKKIRVDVFFNKITYPTAMAATGIYGNMGQLTPKSQMVFEDFKIEVSAKRVYNAIGPTATIKIYGVSKQHMDSITTMLFRDSIEIDSKRVRVSIDNGGGYFTLFEGWITEAVPVYRTAPDCYIQIESSMAAYENNMKLPPISFESSSVAISSICDSVCSAYGVKSYTSNLVKSQLPVAPLRFGANEAGLNVRVGEICEAYGLNAVRVVDGYRFYMKEEKGSGTPFYFTPANMIGYPSYKNKLLQIQTEDFRNIDVNNQFYVSGSQIPYANGLWYASIIQYNLQSWTANGKWQATIYGGPVGGRK